jgi:hypothetical protein
MSMATGFEVRVPFCDYRLVQYVWNIPWEMKTTGNIEKGILREALRGILPDDVRTRKKSPYPISQNPTYLPACVARLGAADRERYERASSVVDQPAGDPRVGALATILATLSGAGFVVRGDSGSSLSMALGFLLALIASAMGLYVTCPKG